MGGAHRDRRTNIRKIFAMLLIKNLEIFENLNDEEIITQRKNKFLQIGRNLVFGKSDNNIGLSIKKTNLDTIFQK